MARSVCERQGGVCIVDKTCIYDVMRLTLRIFLGKETFSNKMKNNSVVHKIYDFNLKQMNTI